MLPGGVFIDSPFHFVIESTDFSVVSECGNQISTGGEQLVCVFSSSSYSLLQHILR